MADAEEYTVVRTLDPQVTEVLIAAPYAETVAAFRDAAAGINARYLPAEMRMVTNWSKVPGLPAYTLSTRGSRTQSPETQPVTLNLANVVSVAPATVA